MTLEFGEIVLIRMQFVIRATLNHFKSGSRVCKKLPVEVPLSQSHASVVSPADVSAAQTIDDECERVGWDLALTHCVRQDRLYRPGLGGGFRRR